MPESIRVITETIQMDVSNNTLNTQPLPLPSFPNDEGMLHLLYAGAIVVMYPSLAQLIQLKFLNNKPSPFESHTFLTYTSVVAYIVAITTLTILFYMRAYFEKRERFSPAVYMNMILKTVFYLSGSIAPLSLVLVLLLPQNLIWIGYIILFLVFANIVLVACNFGNIAKRLYEEGMSTLGINFQPVDPVKSQTGPPPARVSLV